MLHSPQVDSQADPHIPESGLHVPQIPISACLIPQLIIPSGRPCRGRRRSRPPSSSRRPAAAHVT
jgi:hypothetical protein